MGVDYNAELLQYFKERQVWIIEPDIVPPKLSSYMSSQPAVNARSNPAEGEVR